MFCAINLFKKITLKLIGLVPLVEDVFDGEPVLFVNILGVFAFKKTVDPAVPLTNIFP
jgi:hypothetical protein